jgi:DNA polymerase sliding clamp subunit (PCNA homolog)
MTISYTTFIKHASKVTKSATENRPALKGIFHRAEDGALIVTDSHRLYKAAGVYSGGMDAVINPVTGETIDGVYPDADKVIPRNPKAEFQLESIERIVQVLKPMAELARYSGYEYKPDKKGFQLLDLVTAFKDLVLTTRKNYVSANLVIGGSSEDVPFSETFRATYLLEALDLFRDAGYDGATLQYFGDMRPIVIKNDNLLALILPVRTF